jgi:xanthine dehydrogenase molybdopterin-binding subunit B
MMYAVKSGQEILSTDLLYDCGDSLSPEIDLGQVEGSFIIGVGHFLTEVSAFIERCLDHVGPPRR